MPKITFSKGVTFEGATEWTVYVDGSPEHLLTRSPQRKFGSMGYTIDPNKPCVWDIDGLDVDIQDGATAHEAKRAVKAHLEGKPEHNLHVTMHRSGKLSYWAVHRACQLNNVWYISAYELRERSPEQRAKIEEFCDNNGYRYVRGGWEQ